MTEATFTTLKFKSLHKTEAVEARHNLAGLLMGANAYIYAQETIDIDGGSPGGNRWNMITYRDGKRSSL